MVRIMATTSTGEFVVDLDEYSECGESMVRLLSLRARLLSAPLYLEPLPRQLDLTPYFGPLNMTPQLLAQMTWQDEGEDEGEAPSAWSEEGLAWLREAARVGDAQWARVEAEWQELHQRDGDDSSESGSNRGD